MIGARRPGTAAAPRRDSRCLVLPCGLAAIVFVAVMSGIGLLATGDTLRAARRSLGATLTLQIPPDASQARVETALAALRQAAGVVSVRPLEPAETERLLEPVIGKPAPPGDLPLPRLIDIRTGPVTVLDAEALRRQLASIVPDAQLVDYRELVVRMRDAARLLDGILVVAIAAATVLIALSAAMAGRVGLAIDRPRVELSHLLGATDRDLARPFMLETTLLAAVGSAGGAAAALLTAIALGSDDALVRFHLPGAGDWRLWAVAAGAPLAATLIAAAGARTAVTRRLARMP
jgi:cell division transport system permease protein